MLKPRDIVLLMRDGAWSPLSPHSLQRSGGPDGRTRAIFFEKGKAITADLSQADGNMTFSATKERDLYKIQAGDERYEIPEAVVFGG